MLENMHAEAATQLRSANLLTGQRYVAIDMFPHAPQRDVALAAAAGARFIPTAPETIGELQARNILVDGLEGELLLQIFSENQLGPIFFEFIQRKGNEGFGEGNFKALFETMELDQMRRGVVQAKA